MRRIFGLTRRGAFSVEGDFRIGELDMGALAAGERGEPSQRSRQARAGGRGQRKLVVAVRLRRDRRHHQGIEIVGDIV